MGISISGIVDGGEEFLTGAHTAPTPQVSSRPAAEVQPETWQAPDVSAKGELSVHADHLTSAADVLRAHLPEIQDAVTAIQQMYGSFGCLNAWPQGQAMCSNLTETVQSFVTVSQQTHDAHAGTASNLKASADTYAQKESDSTRAARSAGTPSPPSSNWKS